LTYSTAMTRMNDACSMIAVAWIVALAPACKTTGAQEPRDASGPETTGAAGAAAGNAGAGAAGVGGSSGGGGGNGGAPLDASTTGAGGAAGGGRGGGGSGSGGFSGVCPTAPPVNFEDPAVRAQCGKIVYVAGGDNNHVIISSDGGTTWSSMSIKDIAGDDYVNNIAVDDGIVSVVGLAGFYTSVDAGKTFSIVDSIPHVGFNSSGGQINFGAGMYVLTDNFGTFTSTDGTTWTSIKPFPDGSEPSYFGGHSHGVAYGASTYVAFQDQGAFRTLSGSTWTQGVVVDANHNVTGAAYGNGTFVVFGQTGTGTFSVTSTDGKAWTHVQTKDVGGTAFAGSGSSVVFDGTMFHYYGSNASKTAYTSPDGSAWTKITVSDNLDVVAYDDGHYFGTGENSLLISSDGATWTKVHTFTTDETFMINGPRVGLGYALK
jgi:hypothetical protein